VVKEGGPGSAASRGLRMGKLGLMLAGSYLGYQLQNLWLGEQGQARRRILFHQKASRRVRKELESLKGPFMKFGQILSMQTQALPDEAIGELANLQMHAPGMHPTLARAQFRSSYGKNPEEVFRAFEDEPFAAASLGQVHRAVTRRGDKVAVKIQYPAIRTAIENDFRLLRSATLPGRLTGHAPVAILDEVQRGFLEEIDYINEGKNLDFFREKLRGFAFLTIPRVHWDLTTDRVLTMSFVEGVTVGDFLQGKPSQAARDLIGSRLFELFHFQVQCIHALHADPHAGNYLFEPDGRIGLVDFGCVKHFSGDIAELMRCCVERFWLQGKEQSQRVIQLIWGPKVSFTKARRMLSGFEEFLDIVFPPAGDAGALVDFGKPALLSAVDRTVRRAVRHKLTNAEFAFISRAELGLYNLLHQLRARVNTREVWRRVLERAAAKATRTGTG
jgi:predicted unusual protein kinase regulating ubiquinone biosynthesis (AarF/ABC1/UbiB family)